MYLQNVLDAGIQRTLLGKKTQRYMMAYVFGIAHAEHARIGGQENYFNGVVLQQILAIMEHMMKDFLGQNIRPGDIIVYPTRRSPVKMNKARVISVEDGFLRVVRSEDSKTKQIKRTDNVTVVTKQLGERD